MPPSLSYPLAAITCALPFAAFIQAEPVKPAHDPPGQLFRHAPMPKATRSIIIPFGNIQFAFDTENLRAHTVWRGRLDLYGPQHVNAKRPFIAQPNGTILWGNPPTIPWRTNEPSAKFSLNDHQLKGKFIGTAVVEKLVTLRYSLQLASGDNVAIQLQPTISAGRLQRKITLSQCRYPLWFLSNSFPTGSEKFAVTALGPGVSVQVVDTPLNYTEIIVTESGAETVYDTKIIDTVAEQHWVLVPPHEEKITLTITTHHDGDLPAIPKTAASDLAKLGAVGQAEFRPRSGPTNPYYKTEHLPLPSNLNLLITGMDWFGDGRLAVCTWPGEVYLLDGLLDNEGPVTFNRLAKGLNEPMGLLVKDGKLYVSQKPELTEITINKINGGGIEFTRVSADWGYSGHYNAFSYGPVLDRNGHFVLANAGHSGRWDMKFMGWAIRQGSNETMEGIASGFREPNGIAVYGPERDVFVTDNQGHWTAVCELNHIRPGKYFGRPSATPDPKKLYQGRGTFTAPAIWFPYTLARSISGLAEIMDDQFGPFKGQLIVGDFQNALLTRVFLEKVNGEYQGAVFPFLNGFRSGVNRLCFSQNGNLFVGGLQRTWASIAPDPASLERVTFYGNTPFSIRKVMAKPDGFLLTLTEPASPSAADPKNFDVSQFRYTYHPNYGSPRFNHTGEKDSQTAIEVDDATLSADRLELRLSLSGLREGHVTQIKCFDVISDTGKALWQDTFHYTLNQIPKP